MSTEQHTVPRAAVVVTGTEVLGGWVSDRNGPWLAERLGDLGVDHVYTTVVGDDPDEMLGALEHARSRGIDLVVTSGGLGPTEDDRTAEVVAGFAGRAFELDEALEGRIWAIIERFARRQPSWGDTSDGELRAANRKQALVPRGATILEPVGTAPGLVVPPSGDGASPTVLVLPGPPSELQRMWPAALGTDAFTDALAGARELRRRTLRLQGIPEAALAGTMRDARDEGVGLDRLEINTCAHRGELEVVVRWRAEHDADEAAFTAYLADRHADALYSSDGRSVDQQVLDGLRDAGWRVATAESCTAGLVAGRLTDLAGSSDVVAGGIVAYANDVKEGALGVDAALLEAHGAVSAEVAVAMARGAVERLGVDVAVSTTGVAGPGGGTAEKPVGTVHIAVATADGGVLARKVMLPGTRAAVRDRTTTAALHLLRRVLAGERDG